jgi:uncharacterized membrane protein
MDSELKTSKWMNIVLWIAQGILASTLIWAGYMKISRPEELPFPWIKEQATLVTISAIIDILGGVGILFPALLRIQPKLTILVGYGIIALMICAIVFHIMRGEAKDIAFNIFMILVAVFIVWGRNTKAPIVAK